LPMLIFLIENSTNQPNPRLSRSAEAKIFNPGDWI